ncbi:MAG: substrate-binding domain-containing protein [Bacteroidales bacterium]
MVSCNKNKDRFTDTFTTGVIGVAIDESFEPVMQQEIMVFEQMYPLAGIVPSYVSETDAFNLFLQDSVRLAITTRTLSEAEIKSFEERKFFPKSVKIATDGIALIINKENSDTLITVNQLENILTGKIRTWNQLYPDGSTDTIKIVFDHPNSSSVRYALDSICKGAPLASNIYAQKNNPQVIDFVAKNRNAIGIIGVSWIGNRNDSTILSFINNVRVMSVSSDMTATPENSYKPYQAYVALGDYPLTRNIYALLNDPRGALPSGFYTFLTSGRGQQIILKSGIVPATQPIRIVNTRDQL